MSNNKLHTKPASALSWRYRRCNDIRRSPLAGESQIVELISLGVPLPGILNKICAAIVFQIGNVVSHVFLPDEQDNDLFRSLKPPCNSARTFSRPQLFCQSTKVSWEYFRFTVAGNDAPTRMKLG